MLRSMMTTALVLVLALGAAGCGTQNAGTSANRWGGTGPAVTVPGKDRGEAGKSTALEARKDGSYYADEDGRVSDFMARKDDSRAGDDGAGLSQAGRELARGAQDAARNVGDAAEDLAEGVTDAARSAKGSMKSAME